MKAARDWGTTPLVMLLGDDDPKHGSWATRRNRLLATALTIHESQICGGCGQPLHESTDPDGPDYSVEDYVCRGCAVSKDAGSESDEPGTHWYLSVKRQARSGVVPR